MIGGKLQRGFTIVEVMIFLAVSGGLFLVGVAAVNGKQAQAEFSTGTQDFNSRLQTVINDVTNGYYPQNNNYYCHTTSPGTPDTAMLSFTRPSQPQYAANNQQGTHSDCIFLGKVVYFNFSNPLATVRSFSIISVAGHAQDSTGQPVSKYADALPVAVDIGTTGSLDLTETANLSNGMVVTDVLSNQGRIGIQHPAAFAIFTSLPQVLSGGQSGTLATNLMAVPGSNDGVLVGHNGDSIGQVDAEIKNMTSIDTTQSLVNPTTVVCLAQQGVGGKRAAVIIKAQNHQVQTELHIGDIDNTTTGVPSVMGGTKCP